jgi:hypothetical protein
MLRRNNHLLFLSSTRALSHIFHPDTAKAQMKKNRSGYHDIDPDRMREFEEMQTGMARESILKKRKEDEEFLALPREEQIRKFMLSQRKFDVDLVRKNNMNIAEEFDLFKKTLKKNDRRANIGFYGPFIMFSIFIWGGSSYWVFWWY